jgi:hypothetical protein
MRTNVEGRAMETWPLLFLARLTEPNMEEY